MLLKKKKKFKNTFFRKISAVSQDNKWADDFFEDGGSGGLQSFGEIEWNLIGGKYECN